MPVEFLKYTNVGWLSLNMYPAEEEEEGEQGDQQPQTSPSDSNTKVFKVTCGRLEGNLHMNRFASGKQISLSRKCSSATTTTHGCSVAAPFLSPLLNVLTPPGTRGKSIRTEESWLTPMEFLKEALGDTDAFWRKDIEWGGEPLSVLIEVAGSILSYPVCASGVAIARLHG